MAKIPVNDHVEYLVCRKFPELAQPAMLASALLGNRSEDGRLEWTPPSTEVAKKAEKFRKELYALSAPELKTLYDEELTKQNLEDDQKRFFNQPHADADIEYWAKMTYWTLDEAIALSYGKNPKIVS